MLAALTIKTFTREGCQPVRQTEVLRVRGLDAARAQAFGIDHFDSTHLGMLFFCLELDHPGFEARLGSSGKGSTLRIAIDQHLWPGPLRGATHQHQRLQEFPTLTIENVLNLPESRSGGYAPAALAFRAPRARTSWPPWHCCPHRSAAPKVLDVLF